MNVNEERLKAIESMHFYRSIEAEGLCLALDVVVPLEIEKYDGTSLYLYKRWEELFTTSINLPHSVDIPFALIEIDSTRRLTTTPNEKGNSIDGIHDQFHYSL
ncbi:hypothetical protein GOBAR_AA29161 [Gossypium barbadense]|uniref:Uncharacterized protein n=1 Tax=Gossypium barbadense TaxID=3634 RepID=A0A2P5WKC0_GOSBA|nr:hypothetical protein GOBAR_AA29161 [Gossypium barbadense]